MNAQAQDEFTEFMLGNWSQLFRLAFVLTGDRGLAEDLVQATLAKVYAAWPRVVRAGNVNAYVRKVLINSSRDSFRRRRGREVLTEIIPDTWDNTGRRRPADLEIRADMLAALMSLPAKQRAAVVMRYWLDMPESEVAQVLGCSVGTVKSQAFHALAKLRIDPRLAEGAGSDW